MKTTYPKYSNNKNSGIPWIEKVPFHWKEKRLKFMITTNPGKSEINLEPTTEVTFVPMEAVDEYGGMRANTTKPIEDVINGYTYFKERDVVVAKITPCFENGKGAIAEKLINGIAFGTTEFHVLRSNNEIDYRYLFYLSITHPFRKIGEANMYGAGGQKRISDRFIKDFQFAFPSLPEQTLIARFLDQKTGQIDRLIEQKEKLLKLLAEKRTAIITRAVTKGLPAEERAKAGLDPNVEMKDSGIDWLGEIPKDWELIPLKHQLKSLNKRRIPLSSEVRSSMSKEFPYYGASGIIDYVEDYIFDEDLILIAEDGANLLSRSTPLAFIATGKYWVNNHAHILASDSKTFGFWSNLLCIIDYTPWITGAAQPKLTKENLGSITLPQPPKEEQLFISGFIHKVIARFDPLIDEVKLSIKQLKEYREALITSAVTGQIKV